MNRPHFCLLLAAVFFLFGSARAAAPRVFLLDAAKLAAAKRRIAAGDRDYARALAALKSAADRALAAENLSVVAKDGTPPSGDKHDYMSQAPYFWRNPNTPDGLPYVRRDGERNPEIARFPDHDNLDRMSDAVRRLALAYYFTGDERYAAKAAAQLRVWFLAPATRMNPNMEFAQAVPGESTGRIYGVLEARTLTGVVDAIGLIDGSKSLAAADRAGLEKWFADFLAWLTTSKNGRGEGATKNNHGTHYDVQVAAYALFLGRTGLAREVLAAARRKRIAVQIEPDGRQPEELARTKAWNYSVMNLEGMMQLARLGESAGVDLWKFETPDGRGIRRALEYLYPFAVAGKKWEYRQIEGFEPARLFPLVRAAGERYADDKFRALLARIPPAKVDLQNDF